MRIALVASPEFDAIGGVSTHAHTLARALRMRGHLVFVAPLLPPRLVRAPLVSLPAVVLSGLSAGAAYRWEVVGRNWWSSVGAAVAMKFRPDVLNIQSPLHVGVAATWKKWFGCPTVLTVHGYLADEAEQGGQCLRGDPLWRWLRGLEAAAYSQADQVVAVSAKAAEYVRAHVTRTVEVVLNGVDVEHFRPQHQGEVTERGAKPQLRLVFAGVLEPQKGILDAIEVMGLLQRRGIDATLSVAGVGSERAAGECLARDLGVESKLRWFGALAKSEMPRFYCRGDVAIVPSRWRGSGRGEEPFGYTALEAMACGRVVVGYRSGGLVEQIEEGVTGFLVKMGDTQALADRVAQLSGQTELARLGSAARARVEACFSSSRMALEFEELYSRSISKRG